MTKHFHDWTKEAQRSARSANVKREQKQQFRCKKCNKLLAISNKYDELSAQIKCPECGEINER